LVDLIFGKGYYNNVLILGGGFYGENAKKKVGVSRFHGDNYLQWKKFGRGLTRKSGAATNKKYFLRMVTHDNSR